MRVDTDGLTAAYYMLRGSVEYHDLEPRNFGEQNTKQVAKRLLHWLRDLGVNVGGQGRRYRSTG
jgi:hypothetical protein